ncbi:hypothetical protein L6R52_07005, partial [Myxococcota bacterium]|nr:hypothetical protein [Myxococcota bacterium]
TATKLALERLTPRVRATKALDGKSAGDDAPAKPAVVEKPSPKKKQARLQEELTLPEALEKK